MSRSAALQPAQVREAAVHRRWVEATPRAKQVSYPQSPWPFLPRLFWVMLCVGSRGAGKTWLVAHLLKAYEQSDIYAPGADEPCAQRIVLFSPTAKSSSNHVWATLRWLDPDDIYEEYSDAQLTHIIADIEKEAAATKLYQAQLKAFKKWLKRNGDISGMTSQERMYLEMCDYDVPQEPKYPQGCITHLILDDLVGSAAYKQGRSAVTNLVLRNRHLMINVAMCVQNLRSVPKPIRINASVYCVWRYAAIKVVMDDLLSEVNAYITEDDFEALYEHATAEPHQCLVIDFTQPRSRMFSRSLEATLQVNGGATDDEKDS